MRRVRLLLVPVFVFGAGLLISACGGDSSPETPIVVPTQTSSSASGGSLSKAEFIAQADSACKEANAAIEQFASSGQGLTEAGQIADLRKGVVDQINQLGPPAEDKTTLDQFLKAMDDQVSAGQKIGLAEQRGEDTSQFESELDSAKSEAESAATTYGFKECGQQISSSGTSTTSSSSGVVVPSSPSTGSSGSTGGGTSGGSTGGGSTGGGSTGGSGGSGGVGPG